MTTEEFQQELIALLKLLIVEQEETNTRLSRIQSELISINNNIIHNNL